MKHPFTKASTPKEMTNKDVPCDRFNKNKERYMKEAIDHYYLEKYEPHKSCLLTLRTIILDLNAHITEKWSYSMPFFCYKGKRFCYLWTDKVTKEPYIGIVDGNLIEHPALEQGNRSRMKIMRINPNKDIPLETVLNILQLAITNLK